MLSSEVVIAVAAVDLVLPTATEDPIVTGESFERVVAVLADESIDGVAAAEQVISGPAEEQMLFLAPL